MLLSSSRLIGLENEVEWTKHIQRTKFPAYEREVVLWDGSRVDLLGDYAIEVDWVNKWPEAVGQCLLYSKLSGKPPMILLLVKEDGWEKYLARCLIACGDIRVMAYDTRKQNFIR